MAILSPDGERILLGRQPSWPPMRYSCLAGFVDPGETVEEAVRREGREEAGVSVGEVIYHSSQPWPCGPSPQLMLGALAVATSDTLEVNYEELGDARWWGRDEVAAAIEAASVPGAAFVSGPSSDDVVSELKLPPKEAIAHHLIKEWVSLPLHGPDA